MSEIQPRFPEETQPVIIADAEEESAGHVERQLRRAGVKNPVVVFKDGDALHAFLMNAAQSAEPKPCVLMLDPHMPGANGYDPVRWVLREKCLEGLQVAIFSTGEEPEEIESAEELGVHVFLKKHPDLESMSPIIDHLTGVPPGAISSVPVLPTVPAQ
jgi:CheY-like chemotaxis protein